LVGLIALFALEALSTKKLCVIPVDAQKFWENFYFRPRSAAAAADVFFWLRFRQFPFFFIFKKKILKNF
jgi:hypothetical protein